MFTLYDYFRSSAAFRVRISLELKKIPYEKLSVHLLEEGGQHLLPTYRAINPQALVPSLKERDTQTILTQSLAIIEYLEEIFPLPALLPPDPSARAKVRAFAYAIACDIHPLNNLRVLNYLTDTLKCGEEQKKAWYHHWLREGFQALEAMLIKISPPLYAFSDTPTLADICLAPQIYNAQRFGFKLTDYPELQQLYEQYLTHAAFKTAWPE